jgi:hypothetical protein
MRGLAMRYWLVSGVVSALWHNIGVARLCRLMMRRPAGAGVCCVATVGLRQRLKSVVPSARYEKTVIDIRWRVGCVG